MSWRPMVLVSGEWAGNGLRFATKAEAEKNARDLMGRWILVRETRADESSDPVNYEWDDNVGLTVVREKPFYVAEVAPTTGSTRARPPK